MQSSVHRKIFVAAAISLHNIPEGIACATAIFNAGGTRRWACFIATMSGMVEPVFAVLSVMMLGPWLTIRLIDLSLVSVSISAHGSLSCLALDELAVVVEKRW